MAQCEICGKKVISGNKVSHSKRHTRTTWMPNLQNIKILVKKGTVRKATVCTNCIKSGKVTKAPQRNYKPEVKAETK